MATKKVSAYGHQPQPPSNTSTYVLGAVAVLVAAAAVVGMVLWQNRTATEVRDDGYGTATAAPVAVLEDNAILLGAPAAPATVDLYADFLCPACASFEAVYGQQLARAVDEGKVAVRYRFIDFLNRLSASGDYSTRAAGAALCVAQSGDGAAFAAYIHRLYQPGTQPREGGGADLGNGQLAAIAREEGATEAAAQCAATGANTAAAAAASAVFQRQITAVHGDIRTPTVLRDNQAVDFNNKDWITGLGG